MQADGRLQQAVCLHCRLIYEDGSIKSTNVDFKKGPSRSSRGRTNAKAPTWAQRSRSGRARSLFLVNSWRKGVDVRMACGG